MVAYSTLVLAWAVARELRVALAKQAEAKTRLRIVAGKLRLTLWQPLPHAFMAASLGEALQFLCVFLCDFYVAPRLKHTHNDSPMLSGSFAQSNG
jgi:hypothetical protein